MNPDTVILPTAYFGNIAWFKQFLKYEKIIIEQFDYFEKQCLRNSCEIYGANGLLKLSVPLSARHNKTITSEIYVDNKTNWASQHIRSIESAYNNAPYFEFYWDNYLPILNQKFEKLTDLNQSVLQQLCKDLKISKNLTYSESYLEHKEYKDLRSKKYFSSHRIDDLSVFKAYHQVFEDKFGFLPNLWICDLLFNYGPDSLEYLK